MTVWLTPRSLRAGAHGGSGAGLQGGAGLRLCDARAVAFVVVKRGTVFGTGNGHGRAAPGRQHDERRSFAQVVVEPRQPIDLVHRRADFGLQEQQHPLKNRARHIQRACRASERLAAGIVDDLGGQACRQYQGLADFEADTWYAIFLPKGTPAPIVRALHDAIVATMDTPSVQARLKDIGADLVAPERRSSDYLAKFVVSEIARWAAPIKASGVSMD